MARLNVGRIAALERALAQRLRNRNAGKIIVCCADAENRAELEALAERTGRPLILIEFSDEWNGKGVEPIARVQPGMTESLLDETVSEMAPAVEMPEPEPSAPPPESYIYPGRALRKARATARQMAEEERKRDARTPWLRR